MKPAIAFAVVRRVYQPGWEVLTITSENRYRVFGRDGFDRPTNRALRDILARFETFIGAQGGAMVAQETWNAHESAVNDAARALKRAHSAREQAVQDALAAAAARSAAKPPHDTPDAPSASTAPAAVACDKP